MYKILLLFFFTKILLINSYFTINSKSNKKSIDYFYNRKNNLFSYNSFTKLYSDNNNELFKKDNSLFLNETNNDFYKFGAFPRLEKPNEYGELTWYPIGFSNEFSKKIPKKVTIRDINYIIWKDSNGYYGLRDACSHQGSSFQNGCIEKNTISCPYHGYTFDGKIGNLIEIPGINFIHGNQRHNVNSFKVVEKNDIVFLNTIPITLENFNQIDETKIWIEPEASNPKQKCILLSENFNHYAKFVSINSLDICHIGFVHTFGNRANPNPVYNSIIENVPDSNFHYKINYEYLAGSNSLVSKIYNYNKIIVQNEYILPHTTVARVIFGNFSSTIITIAQPISKFKTRLFVKAYRNYWFNNQTNSKFIYNPFDIIINKFGDYFTKKTMVTTIKQDKFIIDNLDKFDYNTMHGKFSIKYDMMSNHYKNKYRKLFEYDKLNF